jgi:hypothetical protein
MAPHFEISEIRLVRKASGRVQHLSPGPTPMAGFDLTTEGCGRRGRIAFPYGRSVSTISGRTRQRVPPKMIFISERGFSRDARNITGEEID